jgi:hypothetical protein
MLPLSQIRSLLRKSLKSPWRHGALGMIATVAVVWIVHSHALIFYYTQNILFIWYGSEKSAAESLQAVVQYGVNRRNKTDSRIAELSQRRLEDTFAKSEALNSTMLVEMAQQFRATQFSSTAVHRGPRYQQRYYLVEIVSKTSLGYAMRFERRLCVPEFDWPEVCYMPARNRNEIVVKVVEP